MIGSQVQFQNVSKTFGSVRALEDFSLQIAPGEFVTLLGASGSGKSTALNILAGFLDPTSGDVSIDGTVVNGVPSENRNVGMVFQNFALFPHMNVFENVSFPLRMRRVASAEIKRRVEAALEMVRLEAFAERKPAALSGGQRQRVALARAVVAEPPVLLMDECLSALDLKLREELQGEIRRIHREIGTTVVFVTHDQTEALTLSDRVAVLSNGRIAQVDTPLTLYDAPRTRFIADFVGQSNVFDVRHTVSGAADVPDLGVTLDPVPEGATAISLRPERIQLGGNVDAGSVALNGTIEDVAFFGASVVSVVRLASGAKIEVRKSRDSEDKILALGEAAVVSFARTAPAMLFDE
ncbi:ABC transporter ATP-binding protein [Rhodobacteraceae bacterium D3-12]|nr:ABC transporter ATP-binding protein [Rhodobacteraceae bacterium D3-12]